MASVYLIDSWSKGCHGRLHGTVAVFSCPIWEEALFFRNKLISKSQFCKLTLLDRGMKVIAKGIGSTFLSLHLYTGHNESLLGREETP